MVKMENCERKNHIKTKRLIKTKLKSYKKKHNKAIKKQNEK